MSFEFNLKTEDLKDLAESFAAAAGGIGNVAQRVQTKWAMEVVRRAKTKVPVRTGALQRSIGLTFAGGGEAVAMGGHSGVSVIADMPYAGFVEFGTVYMAPRPYLRPALLEIARPYREDLIDGAAEILGSKRAALRAARGLSMARGSSPGRFTLSKALGNARGNR